jgi:hypothetical protein
MTTPNYKALSEAVVLYTYRLRSLVTGVEDSDNTVREGEYNDAYNLLLRTQNLIDGGPVPADPGADANAIYFSEEHILALRTAILLLTEALRAMEKKRKEQEDKDDKTEILLKFIASQQLSSRALHQVMLRFAEYRDIASRESTRATEQIMAFNDDSASHNAMRRDAILQRDRAIYDENRWSDKVMSLANMMALKVQAEEHARRMQRTLPRRAAGGNDDIGESPEDEETDEDSDESPAAEGSDEDTDQLLPDHEVEDDLLHDEADGIPTSGDAEQSDLDAEDLNIGKMTLGGSATRTATNESAEGKEESKDRDDGEEAKRKD